MPIHVDDEYVSGNTIRIEMVGEVNEFCIGIQPVPAPPVTEGIFGRQRDTSRHLGEISKRFCVFVPVSENIPVNPVSFRSGIHPIFPVAVCRDQHMSCGLINDCPSIARNHPFVVRIVGNASVGEYSRGIKTVQGAAGAKQVAGIVRSGLPDFPDGRGPSFLVHRPCHLKGYF